MKKVVILGSTGKIGTQTLEVIKSYPYEFKVVGLACFEKSGRLAKQIQEFKPRLVAAVKVDGEEKLSQIAGMAEADLVVVAVVGMAGVKPTLAAIKAGKKIALATKEVLVVAGEAIVALAKKHHTEIIPIDSEPSAIFQALKSGRKKEIKKIILTMGKGPIARMKKDQLAKVTMKQILNRATWSLGDKIAVDSATGINKAFEVIEVCRMFDLAPGKVEIVVHPEYLCHSMVEFIDGSIIGEFGTADMKRYIQYALFYPQRKLTKVSNFINLVGKKITFEKPSCDKFPCLQLGFEVAGKGGTMPAVLHGADRAAVTAFLKKRLAFTDIPKVIKKTMASHKVKKNPALEQVFEAEKWAQEHAKSLIQGGKF